MLHIRCGDDILSKLKDAGLPGEMIRWADALCQGPTPAGLKGDEWRRVRAQHAKDFYGMPYDEGMEFLRKQDEIFSDSVTMMKLFFGLNTTCLIKSC